MIKNAVLKMSSNPKANCYAFATGCRKLYLSSVGCQ